MEERRCSCGMTCLVFGDQQFPRLVYEHRYLVIVGSLAEAAGIATNAFAHALFEQMPDIRSFEIVIDGQAQPVFQRLRGF